MPRVIIYESVQLVLFVIADTRRSRVNTDNHLRRYDCTTSTCNALGDKQVNLTGKIMQLRKITRAADWDDLRSKISKKKNPAPKGVCPVSQKKDHFTL